MASTSSSNAIIVNLLSAAIAQAGVNQAGALSYDFKVEHLVGFRLDVQIPGQMIGSLFGALVSSGIYKLYTSQYMIPGTIFRVPSSFVVLSTARLLLGRGLPNGVTPFVASAAILSALSAMIKMRYRDHWWHHLIPSAVAFAIGNISPSNLINRIKQLRFKQVFTIRRHLRLLRLSEVSFIAGTRNDMAVKAPSLC